MFRANPVQHFSGVEGAGHGAGPALALERPTEQDGENLVRIDEVAILICRPDAVGVAVGAQAGLAAVGHHRLAQGADVWLDGLGIDAGKERVGVPVNLHVGHAQTSKNVGDNGPAGTIHGVDGKLHS